MIELVVGLTDRVSAPAKNMRSAMIENAEKVKSLQDRMKGLGKEIDELRAKQLKYKEAGLHGVASQAGLEISKLRLHMKGLGNELKDAKGHQKGLTDEFEKANPAASKFNFEMGIATTVLKLYAVAITAVIAAFVAGGAMALSAAEFKQESLAAFTALSGSAIVGRETLDIIRELERSVPETEAQLVERAKGLLAMGLDTKSLKGTLRDISNVSAAFGEAGGSAIEKVIEKTLSTGRFKIMPKQLLPAGISEKDLAQQLGMTPQVFEAMMKAGAIGADKGLAALHSVIDKKMGGLAAEKVLTLGGLANKLGDNLKHLFEGIKIEPFLFGLKGIIDLFDTTKGSGQAMKWVLESIFNKGFKESGSILLGVKHGIQDVAIGGLKLYISFKPTIAQFKSLWAQAKKSDDLKMAILGLVFVMGLLAASVAIPAAVLLVLGAATLTVAAAIALGVGFMIGKIMKVASALRVLGKKEVWKNLAADMIQGLIDGLTKGIKPLQATVHKIAEVLPKGLQDKLEIHSPSRVGERIGERFPEGVAVGVGKGEARVGIAATKLGARAAEGAGGGTSGGGKGGGVHVDKIEVNNNGVDSEGKAIRMTATSLADVFEQLALKEGLGLAT